MAGTSAQKGKSQHLIGQVVAGRYRLVRALGDGGMGSVFKAEDTTLRRFVALKLLHPAAAQNPAAVERFLREARSAASIGHPNIIDILDFGEADGKPFLVMEYLRGRSLADVLHMEGAISIDRACCIATHALAGLRAAHSHGILHRDLKPANLMLVARFGDRSFVKLLDFGFAASLSSRELDSEGRTLTPARTLVGTPVYAAPERLRGDDRRDPRTDLYSLGVVLFEMLTGVRPFDAPSFSELARKAQNDPPPALRLYRPDVPEGLDRVLAQALAKSAEARFESAEAFANALVPYGGPGVEQDASPSDSLSLDLVHLSALDRNSGPKRTWAGKIPRAALRTDPPPPPSSSDMAVERWALDADRAMPSGARGNEATLRMSSPFADAADETLPRSTPRRKSDGAGSGEAPRPRQKTTPVPSQPAPARGRACSAMVAIAILRFAAERYGDRALKGLLTEVGRDAQSIFNKAAAHGEWVAWDAVRLLAETIDARLGRDDLHLVADCGRAIADGTCAQLEKMVGHASPPAELLLTEMPTFLSTLLTGVSCSAQSIGRGYGRLALDEQGAPPSLTLCVLMLGLLDRMLSRFGARNVQVNLINCRYLGDAENLFDISWYVT